MRFLLAIVIGAVAALGAAPAAQAQVGVNPYTGLPADASALGRRPVLIKLANTANVRPQAGLGEADVVVEHIVEGGGTRFSALYLSNSPKRVGSTRSCRLIDIELPVIFGAALSCSGTSAGVRERMAKNAYLFPYGGADWKRSLTLINDAGRYECATCVMFRASDRPVPHNLFASPAAAWSTLAQRGLNQPSSFGAFHFDAGIPSGGRPTEAMAVRYLGGAANWAYDAASGQWLRSTAGVAQVDPNTKQRMSAANVLVLTAPHIDTLIVEDSLGSKSIEIQLWGSGPARLYRDGQAFDGTWVRGAGVYNFRVLDASGNTLAFKPGKTWIQIASGKTAVQ